MVFTSPFVECQDSLSGKVPFITAYHGTQRSSIPSIQKQGLVPQTNDKTRHGTPGVSLTLHPSIAQGYAESGPEKLNPTGKAGFPSDPVVLKVKIPVQSLNDEQRLKLRQRGRKTMFSHEMRVHNQQIPPENISLMSPKDVVKKSASFQNRLEKMASTEYADISYTSPYPELLDGGGLGSMLAAKAYQQQKEARVKRNAESMQRSKLEQRPKDDKQQSTMKEY